MSTMTFDATNAISGIYMWTLFGFLAPFLLNCDLQRFVKTQPLILHLLGLIACLFLFALENKIDNESAWWVVGKSCLVYALFVLMTKMKWYFILPVLGLLVFDQFVKKFHAEIAKKTTKIVNIAVIFVTLIGSIQYMLLQRLEYGKDFSLYKFFVYSNQCKLVSPDGFIKMVKKERIRDFASPKWWSGKTI